MSGRLIITGKKTYTPWNAKNRERVLRDERLERERIEREEQMSRQEFMQERIKKMKKRMGISPDVVDGVNGNHLERGIEMQQHSLGVAARDGDEKSVPFIDGRGQRCIQEYQESKHVNLFEEEEKMKLASTLAGSPNRSHEGGSTYLDKSKTSVGIVPVFLVGKGGGKGTCQTHLREQNNESEFYQRKSMLRKEVDDKLKDEMDPMRRFHNDNGSVKMIADPPTHNQSIVGQPTCTPRAVEKSGTCETSATNDDCDIISPSSSRRRSKKQRQRNSTRRKGEERYKESMNREKDQKVSINRIEVKNQAADARLNVHRDNYAWDLSSASLSSSSSSSCKKSMKRRRKGHRRDYERKNKERGTKRHKKQKKHSREVVDKTKCEPSASQKMEALRRRQMERNKKESVREFSLRES